MNQVDAYLVGRGSAKLVETLEHEDIELSRDEVEEALDQLVNESVTDNPHRPPIAGGHPQVDASPKGARTRKPSNVDVSMDIETALLAIGEISALATADPVVIGSTVATLCALVVSEATEPLSVESGFVYAKLYDRWGLNESIPLAEGINHIIDEADSPNIRIKMDKEKAKVALHELDRAGCLTINEEAEDPLITLNERCKNSW